MKTRIIGDEKLIYNDRGNVIKIYDKDIMTHRYRYDAKSRIIREDNYFFNSTITYKYNKYGLVSERCTYKYTLSNLTEEPIIDHYIYSATDPHRLIGYNDEHFVYDEAGDPIIYRDARLKWSTSHNLLAIDNCSSYEYNQNNVRISKTSANEITKYYVNDNQITFQESGDLIIFIYKNNEICGFSYRSINFSQDFIYKKNYNGDIVGIYNDNNELICKYIYDALGNNIILIKDMNNNYIDISINSSIYSPFFYMIANINPYRYHGEYFDTDTGLYYINGNYYDSNLGVYINQIN